MIILRDKVKNKGILQNIDNDEISYRLEFGISNRATESLMEQVCQRLCVSSSSGASGQCPATCLTSFSLDPTPSGQRSDNLMKIARGGGIINIPRSCTITALKVDHQYQASESKWHLGSLSKTFLRNCFMGRALRKVCQNLPIFWKYFP